MNFTMCDWQRCSAVLVLLASSLEARQSNVQALQAFDLYVGNLEHRWQRQHASPNTYVATADVWGSSQGIRIEGVNGGMQPVRGGLLHHWRGAAFIPAARAEDMLALLRDYRALPRHYGPQVESCRVLSQRGDTANLTIRLKMHKVVTVVLDADYDVHIGLTTEGRGYGISRSTRVRQIDDSGTASERERGEDADDGLLWRLNSYWSFLEVPGGLVIELEAVSLTRDVPAGLGWLVLPVAEKLPRESLEFTLRATTKALLANVAEEAHR